MNSDFLRSMDRFFAEAFQNFFAPSIPLEMYEIDDEYIIEAKLPGVSKEQIRIDVFDSYLRLRVKHEEFLESKDEKNAIKEQKATYSSRERIIPLPSYTLAKNVKATFQNGLLRIRIPLRSKPIEIE